MTDVAKRSAFVVALGRELGVRETRVPLPNFREHGRTTDAALLRLVGRLQVRHGQAFTSERVLRVMLHEDTGLMPGVSTIPKAIDRLRDQGLIVQEWLYAGQILPDGSMASHGARLLWCPQNRRQRFSARAYNAKQDRRVGVKNRCVPASSAGAIVAQVAAGKALPPTQGKTAAEREELEAKAFESRRAESLRRARELAAQWADDKPPD